MARIRTVVEQVGERRIDTEELSEHFVGRAEHKAKVKVIVVMAARSVRALVVAEQTVFAVLIVDATLFLCKLANQWKWVSGKCSGLAKEVLLNILFNELGFKRETRKLQHVNQNFGVKAMRRGRGD